MQTEAPPFATPFAQINIRTVDCYPPQLLIETLRGGSGLYDDKLIFQIIFRIDVFDQVPSNPLPVSIRPDVQGS